FLGEPGHQVVVQQGSYTLTDGDVQHRVRVLQVPWQDYGTLPGAALQACAHQALRLADGGRLAVHCMAGQGRTGTFAAAAQLVEATQSRSLAQLSPYERGLVTLLALRCQRRDMVETAEQFASLFV
ncbi:MAG: hypothetical protein EOO40_07495, partial [Deltaproteobacteria bacterium]